MVNEIVADMRRAGEMLCPLVTQPPTSGWTSQENIERPIGAVLLGFAERLEAALSPSAGEAQGSHEVPTSPDAENKELSDHERSLVARIEALEQELQSRIASTRDVSAPDATAGNVGGSPCINCGERNDGGYETWEGEVGPFCGTCWDFLRTRGPNPADCVYFDEDAGCYVAKHTVITAARTREEAPLALASAIRLTAATWPSAGEAPAVDVGPLSPDAETKDEQLRSLVAEIQRKDEQLDDYENEVDRLNTENQSLKAEIQRLTAYRSRNIDLALRLSKLLGVTPDEDGSSFESVIADRMADNQRLKEELANEMEGAAMAYREQGKELLRHIRLLEAAEAEIQRLEDVIDAFNKNDHDEQGAAEVFRDMYEEQKARADTLAAEVQRLTDALKDICLRIEKTSGQAETHRELSAYRESVLRAVYAIAETALFTDALKTHTEKE